MEKKWIIGLLILTVLLSGCTGETTAPNDTPIPTVTPQVISTPTMPQATPIPTITITATATSTMTITATPTSARRSGLYPH